MEDWKVEFEVEVGFDGMRYDARSYSLHSFNLGLATERAADSLPGNDPRRSCCPPGTRVCALVGGGAGVKRAERGNHALWRDLEAARRQDGEIAPLKATVPCFVFGCLPRPTAFLHASFPARGQRNPNRRQKECTRRNGTITAGHVNKQQSILQFRNIHVQ